MRVEILSPSFHAVDADRKTALPFFTGFFPQISADFQEFNLRNLWKGFLFPVTGGIVRKNFDDKLVFFMQELE